MTLHLKGKDELTEAIEKAGDKLVVIDFYATWCGPCRAISPVVDKMAEEMDDVVFIKIDVDENDDIAEEYDVSVMPTFVFLKNGEQIFDMSGASEANLRSSVDKYK